MLLQVTMVPRLPVKPVVTLPEYVCVSQAPDPAFAVP